ncbi:MAG: ferredoxin [Candidatus Fraserbacteria bacterium RBG_16_55_9]|uniref:Ferredoxin n=1 Tax=Fraserbacteria sp. (strain RBG_16_55_9) TaxID=1817864 RepID=A0A1F5UV99_FRAXR|nr:MAG: ferredoxin [Candidatus Fraserbacteria bacterium RBG_16_55_9]
MLANYGYKDGSGEYFIAIDTDKCNGCGACVKACPADVFEITADPFDPLAEKQVAVIKEDHRKKIKYSCALCKPTGERPPLPCTAACEPQAIAHSW